MKKIITIAILFIGCNDTPLGDTIVRTLDKTIISVDSTSHIDDDYTYSDWDRLVDAVIYVESRAKSIEMFNIISEEYDCCEEYTFMQYAEIVSRRWNGGYNGDKKRSTIKYWNNVRNRILL